MRTRSFPRVPFSALVAIATLAASLSAAGQGNGVHSNGSGTTIHGMPPSVTSFGFGGQPGFHGLPASVTSLNFGNPPLRINHGIHQSPFFGLRRHRDHGFVNPFYSNVIAVPYAYPVYVTDPGMDDSVNDSAEEDDRGGPTIFDRRGSGTANYYAPERGQDEPNRSERNRSEEDYRTASPAPASQPEVAQQP